MNEENEILYYHKKNLYSPCSEGYGGAVISLLAWKVL